MAQSPAIVFGAISSVIDEKVIGPYGEDGQPIPVCEDAGIPYTDYEVRIESVLKGDSNFEDGGTHVLRMSGHLRGQGDVVTLAAVQLSEPGSGSLELYARSQMRPNLHHLRGMPTLVWGRGTDLAER